MNFPEDEIADIKESLKEFRMVLEDQGPNMELDENDVHFLNEFKETVSNLQDRLEHADELDEEDQEQLTLDLMAFLSFLRGISDFDTEGNEEDWDDLLFEDHENPLHLHSGHCCQGKIISCCEGDSEEEVQAEIIKAKPKSKPRSKK